MFQAIFCFMDIIIPLYSNFYGDPFAPDVLINIVKLLLKKEKIFLLKNNQNIFIVICCHFVPFMSKLDILGGKPWITDSQYVNFASLKHLVSNKQCIYYMTYNNMICTLSWL